MWKQRNQKLENIFIVIGKYRFLFGKRFNFSREMKKREDYLLNELEIFMETERRLMQTLYEVLKVENGNLHDACIWVDSLLNENSNVKDEEIARIKNVFVEGLEYLRNFQVNFFSN